MVIGFLGKGGSGKSTLATAMTKYLHAEGDEVLAIDADHNMDMVWNLTDDESLPYLGESIGDLNEYTGIGRDESYKQVFYRNISPIFSLNPADSFTSKYSKNISPKLSIMASGPHTNTVLHGNKCSHSLSTSLKVYLPFLALGNEESVVVDEKASSDAAGTGVPTGFTVSYIVVEPTPHSIKAAHQIAETLDFYGVPHEFVLNKVTDEEKKKFAISLLKKEPLAVFEFSNGEPSSGSLSKLAEHARNLEKNDPDARKNRSIRKFISGKEFAETMGLS